MVFNRKKIMVIKKLHKLQKFTKVKDLRNLQIKRGA